MSSLFAFGRRQPDHQPVVVSPPADSLQWAATWTWLALVFLVTSALVAAQPADEEAAADPTFLDTVTVTATRSERSVKETPGQVDVVRAQEIAELGHSSSLDLVKYLPGVYVDGDPTRLGVSGFNIRGIGGNRVLTRVDGIPTAEQFDFGPFSITQYSLDVEALESVEIVRSAGSSLYGSDALGGMVSLSTRGPRSYLGDGSRHLGLRLGYDGRNEELSESAVFALGDERWQGSVLYGHRDGHALGNQGTVDSEDFTRTSPNPIDREQHNILAKLGHTPSSGSQLEATVEWFDSEAATQVLSAQQPSLLLDSDALDRQTRLRASVEQSLVRRTPLFDSLLWRAYVQNAETTQDTAELRLGSADLIQRDGLLSFDQDSFGLDLELRKEVGGRGERVGQLLTYGVSWHRDRFDQLRDRREVIAGSQQPVPQTLSFPTKYFPESEVEELGLFVQGELTFGRFKLVPGLRFDRYALDANQEDLIFLAGNPGTLTPVDLREEAISPRLGVVAGLSNEVSLFAQFARGFRAPPMSAVNNGFTNQAGGYRTLPNPDLEAETSDNLEVGLRGAWRRGSFSVTLFENRYEDFIDTLFLGFNPQEFLVEFQPQNVDDVKISGVELAAEIPLGSSLSLRGAYSLIEGNNETVDEPLESVAPATLVTGLRYRQSSGQWGFELTGTFSAAKREGDLPSGSTQFRTPSSEVFDLAAWFQLNEHMSLQVSARNLGDETWWRWPFVRGQEQDSTTLERYSSPGRSFSTQIRYRF